MTPRIDVRLGPLIDQSMRLLAQADQLDMTVADLQKAVDSLKSTTSGEASVAAIAASTAVITATNSQIGHLRRNAQVIQNLADLYDSCDLSGARALGD